MTPPGPPAAPLPVDRTSETACRLVRPRIAEMQFSNGALSTGCRISRLPFCNFHAWDYPAGLEAALEP